MSAPRCQIRPPLHDWRRHYPTASAIAQTLLAHDGILSIRTRRLLPDIRNRFGVSTSTAMRAVAIARTKAAA